MQEILRILLVEDDVEDAALFMKRCPSAMRVKHVVDSGAALSELRLGGYELCFTDYRLGPASGLDLVRSARAENLRIPIIVVTGQDVESLGENALLAGATDFIAKDDSSTSEIQRVSRWALIRRHVENRRDDALGPDALERLMGPPPTVAAGPLAAQCGRPLLRRTAYVSQAIRGFSQQEMFEMCAEFSGANARIEVTGVLVHVGICFMQIIEGESNALRALLERIHRDSRHRNLAVILDEPIVDRAFARWNMGCFNQNDRHELSPSALDNVLQRFESTLAVQHASREDLRKLIGSLPNLLFRQAMPKMVDLQ